MEMGNERKPVERKFFNTIFRNSGVCDAGSRRAHQKRQKHDPDPAHAACGQQQIKAHHTVQQSRCKAEAAQKQWASAARGKEPSQPAAADGAAVKNADFGSPKTSNPE